MTYDTSATQRSSLAHTLIPRVLVSQVHGTESNGRLFMGSEDESETDSVRPASGLVRRAKVMEDEESDDEDVIYLGQTISVSHTRQNVAGASASTWLTQLPKHRRLALSHRI
jgi:hypothetical protein